VFPKAACLDLSLLEVTWLAEPGEPELIIGLSGKWQLVQRHQMLGRHQPGHKVFWLGQAANLALSDWLAVNGFQ